MDKHVRLPFLGLLKVSLLGVAFPLLLTSHNWAQANTKQDNSLVYAQTPAPSTPQPSKPAEVKKTNLPPEKKQQEEEEKSDDEKKQDLPWFVLPIGFGVLVVLYGGVLWFFPLWLLKLPNQLMIPRIWILPEFRLPDPVLHLFKYPPRVLDAWVKKHIGNFEEKFLEWETVKERKDYVSVPLLLNNKEIKELTPESLRPTFAKEKQVRLLVWGEGGTGKTAIACQIAKWAMMKDKDKSLTEYLMLPIIIEQELKLQSGEGIKPLMQQIVGQIQHMADRPKFLDELLVKQLLRQRRILLIVDHFSEMSGEARNQIDPEHPEFAANALVVTSRNNETFQGIDINIETMTFTAVKLIDFIEHYLKQRQKWKLFEKEQTEFVDECNQLAKILGEQKIIVFLAKLYAERMINIKEKNILGENSSLDNIPDLIIDHLVKLNRQGERNTRNQYSTVKDDAKFIAWKCLEKDYNAQPVEKEYVVTALNKNNAEACLQYFENDLHLIKSIGYNNEQIRFTLDPLAEYLAGLYLVEHYSEDEKLWCDFLTKAEEKSQQEIKGFLLALRECCLTKNAAVKIPDFVAEELGKLVGINLQVEKQQKLKQHISYLIKQLNAPELKDKLRAVEELQKMAETDQDALDGLLIALKIDNITVRGAAAAALGNAAAFGNLGNDSQRVLDGLLASLQNKGDDVNVRRNAVVALGKLGNPSESLLSRLLALLLDQDEYALHDDAAAALGKFGDASKAIVDKLLARLQDKDVDVRSNAAAVLGKLGNASEPILNGLLARLQDQKDHVYVRRDAAAALGKLGNASEPVLNGLLARLQDKDDDVSVRRNVAEMLGNLSNASEPVLNGLLARLQDQKDDLFVRRNVAEVLGNLSNASEPVLNGLLARLQDQKDDLFVRRNAAAALGKLGNASEPILNGLSARLEDPDKYFVVREAATKALEALKKLNNSPENI